MNKSNNKKVDLFFEQAIADGVFPGASLIAIKKRKVVYEKVYGFAQKDPYDRILTPDHFFDLASLTKPIATATLFMKAVEKKLCALEDPLTKYFPNANSQITLAHLLNHSSGLPAYKEYEKEFEKETKMKMDPRLREDDKTAKEWLMAKILAENLENPVGKKVVYSDLGYILLGFILEKIFAAPLDRVFHEQVAKPLGIKLFYNPINKPVDDFETHFVSTENNLWRGKVLTGEVMDERCYLLNGVAGHAGLFGRASDVAVWLSEMMKARKGKGRLIDKKTFNLFAQRPLKGGFTYGFDTPSFPSSSGKYFQIALGHLGYTGTSFWWERGQDYAIILLTNRVHPLRTNEKIKKFRSEAHNFVVKQLKLRNRFWDVWNFIFDALGAF